MIFEEVSTLTTDDINNRLENLINKINLVTNFEIYQQMQGYIDLYQNELMERMIVDDWNSHKEEILKPIDTDVGEPVKEIAAKTPRQERKRVTFNK